MQFLIIASIISATVFGPFSAEARQPWSGHKVVRVTPHTTEELNVLVKLIAENSRLDVWKVPSGDNNTADIQMSPSEYTDITRYLRQHGLDTSIMIDDINSLIMKQRGFVKKSRGHDREQNKHTQQKMKDFDYSQYHQLDDINAWMQQLVDDYKGKVTLFNVTKSYEGRQMVGLKISVEQEINRPAFWIEGGIHSREWISPATVIYMAAQMLENYGKDDGITRMLKSFDWYILPVTNPDGYAYTWIDERTRMWRKTRSKHGICYGVDPNRNWDEQWCVQGASKNPCSDTYCGPSAFSEVEVKGVADFLSKIQNLKGFIDFHSYSQLWMSPWGYTRKLPKDFKQQDGGSATAVEALRKVHGTKYDHGSIANIIYEASGSSADWAYGKLGVKYSYGVELRDTGEYGFLLPPDQIIPSGEETLAALVALAEYVHNN